MPVFVKEESVTERRGVVLFESCQRVLARGMLILCHFGGRGGSALHGVHHVSAGIGVGVVAGWIV